MSNCKGFIKEIVESDLFLDMPLSTQALYFHLGIAADEEGVLNNAKSIQRSIGASEDDINILKDKKYIIPLDDGYITIKGFGEVE